MFQTTNYKDVNSPEVFNYKKKDLYANISLSSEERVFAIGEAGLQNDFSYFFILDLLQPDYLFLSKSVQHVLGYSDQLLLTKCIDFKKDCIDQKDRAKLKEVQRRIWQYYYTIPLLERKNLKFEFNMRIRRQDGSMIQLLQQTGITEVSPQGEPLTSYNACTDITRYIHSNDVKLTIFKFENKRYIKVFEYILPETQVNLTRRQKEIIDLISRGMTSGKIADFLNISLDTVKNHRKKIISGTSAKNMAEAVNLMYSNRIR